MWVSRKLFLLMGSVAIVFALATGRVSAQDGKPTQAIDQGQRVLSAGHSFHAFVPGLLRELAKSADLKDHVLVDQQYIGGSRVIQHWDLAEDKNKAKKGLRTGKVDVLTLSPIYPPDLGIDKFIALAQEHNPKVRVTIQENWLPFDLYDTTFSKRPDQVDHNAPTADELRKLHEPYFKSWDEYVVALNKKHDKQVLFVVPIGQAVIALREKIIAGKAPGLKAQKDLFTDAIGHATAPLQLLNAYCHYAVVYRKSPVGLPVPAALKKADDGAKLNRLLQEIAWEAVTQHPLSGVK